MMTRVKPEVSQPRFSFDSESRRHFRLLKWIVLVVLLVLILLALFLPDRGLAVTPGKSSEARPVILA
jgi:hypothetical protein